MNLEVYEMVKYCINVYDRITGEKISQVITDTEHMIDTVQVLSVLGVVKGYILDDKEKCDDN